MQIPSEIRKCVAFLGCRLRNGKIVIGGSAFFVCRPFGDTNLNFTYAVTAGHCLIEIDKLGADNVLLRINLKSGGVRWVETQISQWLFHPTDESVDVAVMRINLPPEADHLVFPIAGFASDAFMEKYAIGTGDEVFLSGLFSPHTGENRNIPIVRVGNIAAMPEEPIETSFGKMEAFLIECRSISGLSGSPVFVVPGLIRYVQGQVRTASGNPQRQFRLMGLMHGHFGRPPDPGERERLNMGIAIVPTYNKILEVLNQPFIMEHEAKATDQHKKNNLPVADSRFATANEFTKDDFETALKKVSRKVKPKKSGRKQ